MKNFICCGCLVPVLLSGCSTNPLKNTDPFTREEKISNTTMGTASCASLFALIGGLAGDWAGAFIGGASGALLCGGIGYYLDSQEAQLRARLEATGVHVVRDGEVIRLIMPGHILFASDIDRVNPAFYPVLNSIGEVLQEFDDSGIHIQGHTDHNGSDSHNLTLSKRRAASVADYLVYQGVASQRILVLGFGEAHPVADNTTSQGRQLNRRVELLIKPRQ